MKKVLYIMVCFVLLIACRKEANIKLPDTKPLPVLYSYICPDDTAIYVRVTLSQPLYGVQQNNVFDPVTNADVRIYGAQGSAQLPYDQYFQKYRLSTATYPIGYGQTYTITVVTANGDIASAETQVPGAIVPINVATIENVQEKYGSYDRVKIEFQDIGGATNYYRMAALIPLAFSWQTDTLYEDAYVNELYTDAGNDGKLAHITTRIYNQYDSIAYYDLLLYNCSASYYNFHRSLRNYTGDNPFAEPALTYSNVKGGFGCFGAYTRHRFRQKK